MPEDFRNYTLLEVTDKLRDYLQFSFAKEEMGAAMESIVSALRLTVAESGGEKVPRLFSVEELHAAAGSLPPPIAAGILPEKNLLSITASPKEGKTLAALEFLYAVSSGEALFGEYAVNSPGPVVYFGFEDGILEISSRLRRRGQWVSSNYFICPDGFDMCTEMGMAKFQQVISHLPEPPRFIVIDTARHAFASLRDWNDAAIVGQAIRPLLEWSHAHCTVLVVAHNNKDKFASGVNKISGSNAFSSTMDGYMLLENQKVLPNGDLYWDLEVSARGVPRQSCKLRMDTNTLRIHKVLDAEQEEIKRETRSDRRAEARVRVMEQARLLVSFTIREMAEATGFGPDYTRELVKELVAAGELFYGPNVREEGVKRSVPTYRIRTEGNGTGGTKAAQASEDAEENAEEAYDL